MITITDKAVAHILSQLKERKSPSAFIRFGIRGGGCTGFSYVFEFADEKKDTDSLFEKGGARVIVDPKSLTYVDDTEIDFVTNISGYGLKFNNPNVKSNCGCGASISF